jgi:derlin-1
MSMYFLATYGSALELSATSPSQHFAFLFYQVLFLSVLSATLFSTSFYAESLITAMLHLLSRREPFAKIKWLGIITIPYWTLPYALMVADVLQSQMSIAAAYPHIMGILTAHVHHFFKHIWTGRGFDYEDPMVVPGRFAEWFDGKIRGEVADKKTTRRKRAKGSKGKMVG